MKRNKKKVREEKSSDSNRFDLGLSQETKNGIWGVAALGVALIAILAYLGKAGEGGRLFHMVSVKLFGWGIFLVPVAFVMLGVAFLKDIHRKIYKSALLGTMLFVLSFLGIFFIMRDGDFETRLLQGGYLGVALGYPLFAGVGFIASLVVFVILIVVAFLIALNIPLYKLVPWWNPEREQEVTEGMEEKPTELKDNVIIKQGNKIVTGQEDEKQKPIPAPVKAPVPNGDEFVIKLSKSGKWNLPPIDLLHSDKDTPRAGDINANVSIIKRTLAHFGIDVEMGEVSIGPTVTQFTLRPAVGVKLSRITALSSDLSLALAAHPIRIEAPIPGKALVGIEVPNKKSAIVGLRDLIDTDDFKKGKTFLPLAIGRDVAGYPVLAALEKMPHMLIAGATGTGKSVTINSILLSLLYRHSPDTLKMIMVDPKRVELSLYNGIPHLITPVIVDTKKVVNALRWAVREMEKRYEKLSESGSRDLYSYNAKQQSAKHDIMPFIVIVIDELADLMSSHGRDVEAAIVRLAQMARAVGIHLIVSTQRPSVDVITGLIKANITSRIALQVASLIDSRTILDASGAERLLGQGDMLYVSGDTNAKLRRVQGALVTEQEVKDVIKFIKDQAEALGDTSSLPAGATSGQEPLGSDIDAITTGVAGDSDDAGDELFGEAKDVVVQAGKASASLLQRRLKVGYARAARLLDILEERGVIGPGEGAKPREVYVGRDGGATNDMPPQDEPEEIATMHVNPDDKIATEE
ncbi:MAG: DNA translocase FtsK 4TM domain-containing protein [Patescibacteria group bacterium]